MNTYVTIRSAADHTRLFPGKLYAYDGPGLYNKATGYQLDQPQGTEVCKPMVMRDITEFVARAHYDKPGSWKPQVISSRSQRGAYERSNNMRQAGDFKPGEIIRGVTKKREQEAEKANRLASETGLRGPRKDIEWL